MDPARHRAHRPELTTPIVGPTATLEASAAALDALVIGAGPAGALAARTLALAGASVLLIDRAAFPRPKVCGGCIGGHAQRTLATAGLASLLDDLGARRIDRVTIAARGRLLDARLAPTRVLSRDALDAALVRAAIDAGAGFLPRTRARVHPDATVTLSHAGGDRTISPRTIVLAAGLHDAAPHLARPSTFRPLARRSHVGLGATIDPSDAPGLPRHLIMALSRRGYVGLVHLEDGRVNLAAAIDPRAIRDTSPADAVARVLADAGLHSIDPSRLHLRGTPPLTRPRALTQHHNLFAIGDAARFVEPITGEGIAWALAAGLAVSPHVLARLADADAPRTWPAAHRRLLARRQLRCAVVSRAMRSPVLTAAFIASLRAIPSARPAAIRALIGAAGGHAE